MLSRRLLGCLAIALLLPGCPFTDGYYVDQGAAQPDGTDGIGGTGGTLAGLGGSDGVGGDSPHGDAGTGDIDGTGGSTSEVGAGFGSGADTSVGGDTAQGGTGGETPVAGAGGSMPTDGGGTMGGATGGRSDWGGGGRRGGTGGAMGGGPAAGSGGAAASGGMAGGSQYEPACGDAVVKGSSCNEAGQYCYRACGPDSVGFKRETCANGAYGEGECQFPTSGDYSCYSVPAPYQLPTACPGTVPRAAEPCTVPQCTPCFGGTTNNPLYRDSSGTQKTGYCVCAEAGLWTCATSSEPSSWPCPGSPGCD